LLSARARTQSWRSRSFCSARSLVRLSCSQPPSWPANKAATRADPAGTKHAAKLARLLPTVGALLPQGGVVLRRRVALLRGLDCLDSLRGQALLRALAQLLFRHQRGPARRSAALQGSSKQGGPQQQASRLLGAQAGARSWWHSWQMRREAGEPHCVALSPCFSCETLRQMTRATSMLSRLSSDEEEAVLDPVDSGLHTSRGGWSWNITALPFFPASLPAI